MCEDLKEKISFSNSSPYYQARITFATQLMVLHNVDRDEIENMLTESIMKSIITLCMKDLKDYLREYMRIVEIIMQNTTTQEFTRLREAMDLIFEYIAKVEDEKKIYYVR